MKSKTSCFNGPVFRKNLTRFAPAWLLYTVCLLLGLVLMADAGAEYWLSANIARCISFMGIVNFGYGALVAVLLFGDLFQTKLCNALHALPLRRETWFCTNVLSGLFFSVVPTVIMTIPAVILSFFSAMEQGWQIPLYWLLGTNLEYIFFFGLAVLCVFLTGSRIGAAVIYCIVNFLSVLAFYLAEVIYVPHLPGVVAQMGPFMVFCPVAYFASLNLVDTEQIPEFQSYASDGSKNYLLRGAFTVSDEWWYLWVCAAIGVVLIGLALLLYRKRKLECAGDLMATRKLEPAFLVLFSVVAAGVFQLVYVAFIGYHAYGSATFLWIGLAVGWFAGLMLLRRSSRVFSGKSFLGLIAVAAALGLSLLVNAMDPFGITYWTPKAEEVKSVTLHLSYMSDVKLEEPGDIEEAIALHALAADARLEGELGAVNAAVDLEDGDGTYIEIEYEMKDGTTAVREYMILIDSEAGDITRRLFSRIEAIFDNYYYSPLAEAVYSAEDLMEFAEAAERISVSGVGLPEEQLTPENAQKLVQAIIADCEKGNLVQHLAFHPDPVFAVEEDNIHSWCYDLVIRCPAGDLYIDIYADSENTLAWLDETGMTQLLHAKIIEANQD